MDRVQKYQELIIQLRWTIEIGRLYIFLETSLLLSYLMMPQVGHLKQAFHIFGYFMAHPKMKSGSEPADYAINKNRFQQCDWMEFYRNAQKSIPGNMPVSRDNFMSTHCFVDANHDGCTEMRQSQTGILLFCNSVPIIWFIKKQKSVEASMFVSEFTEMNNALDKIEALRCKLCMFGFTIDGSTNIFCDNREVCVNTTLPVYTLSKKNHIIDYHYAQEAIAAETVRLSKNHTSINLSDLFAKTMAAPNRELLLEKLRYLEANWSMWSF